MGGLLTELKRRKVFRGDPPLPSLLGKRTVVTAALLVALGVGLGAGWLLKSGGGVAGGPEADPSIAVRQVLVPALEVERARADRIPPRGA